MRSREEEEATRVGLIHDLHTPVFILNNQRREIYENSSREEAARAISTHA